MVVLLTQLRSWALLVGAQLFTLIYAVAQVPVKQWDRIYGGSSYDGLASMERTADGGYILGGTSFSGISGDKSQAGRGMGDYWIVKIDAQGTKQWERTYGGDNNDFLHSLQQTTDGGYILGGGSESGVSGDKTVPSQPSLNGFTPADCWIVKLDAQGNKQWDRAYGGNNSDYISCLQQTTDGGYILGSQSHSGLSGDKSQAGPGNGDYWIIKVDGQGNKQWDRTLGSNLFDTMESLQQTSDGGYIVLGWAGPGLTGDRTQAPRGDGDYWLVKLDAQGILQWERTYGGNKNDIPQSVQQTVDGGYILLGHSDSDASGEKSQGHYGNNSGYNYDYWVVKTNAAGTLQWERTYGGAAVEEGNVVRQTTDGGYVLGGVSASGISFDKTQPNQGDNRGYDYDYWIVKISASGIKQWDRSYGGNSLDYLYDLEQTSDGGYLLGGHSSSAVSSDKTQPSLGSSDYWLVKLGPVAVVPGPPLAISGDSILCAGQPVKLAATATPAPTAYRWSTGATTPSLVVTQPGIYSLEAAFSGGRTSSAQFRVRAAVAVSLPVSISLGADTALCEGQKLVLRSPVPSSPGLTYRWSDGSSRPTLTVQDAGTYSLQISSDCDSRLASRTVAYTSCLTIPNVITPNGDRQNEHFFIEGLSDRQWTLDVYNRWGRKVYETTNYRNDWGNKAASGIYYYILRQPLVSRIYKGWVEVMR